MKLALFVLLLVTQNLRPIMAKVTPDQPSIIFLVGLINVGYKQCNTNVLLSITHDLMMICATLSTHLLVGVDPEPPHPPLLA